MTTVGKLSSFSIDYWYYRRNKKIRSFGQGLAKIDHLERSNNMTIRCSKIQKSAHLNANKIHDNSYEHIHPDKERSAEERPLNAVRSTHWPRLRSANNTLPLMQRSNMNLVTCTVHLIIITHHIVYRLASAPLG